MFRVFETNSGYKLTEFFNKEHGWERNERLTDLPLRFTEVQGDLFLEYHVQGKYCAYKYTLQGVDVIDIRGINDSFPPIMAELPRNGIYSNATYRAAVTRNLHNPALFDFAETFHRYRPPTSNVASSSLSGEDAMLLLLLGLGVALGGGNSSGTGYDAQGNADWDHRCYCARCYGGGQIPNTENDPWNSWQTCPDCNGNTWIPCNY